VTLVAYLIRFSLFNYRCFRSFFSSGSEASFCL